MAIVLFIAGTYRLSTNGLLTENGTCTNGNVTIGNRTFILKQTFANFIKNLTYDNRPLADIICQSLLNQSTANK